MFLVSMLVYKMLPVVEIKEKRGTDIENKNIRVQGKYGLSMRKRERLREGKGVRQCSRDIEIDNDIKSERDLEMNRHLKIPQDEEDE